MIGSPALAGAAGANDAMAMAMVGRDRFIERARYCGEG
jgi:hypothetical protein